MDNFVYEYPTKVYFGKGAAKTHLPAILPAYGPNVLLAYGGGSIEEQDRDHPRAAAPGSGQHQPAAQWI